MPCPFIGPFGRSKLFWTGTICFFLVQILLVGSKFGMVQKRLFWANFYNLNLFKMIWTRPKLIGFVQNNWHSTKIIWTDQNHFGPVEFILTKAKG